MGIVLTKPRYPIIEGSCEEVADGFIDDAGAPPSRRRSAGKGQSGSGDTRPHIIRNGIIIHEKVGNGSAGAADGDGRGVGGVGGKGDVRSAAAGNSLLNGLDVYGVGAGKQRREFEVGVVRLIGVENVSIIEGCHKMERVSAEIVGIGLGAGPDG